MTTRPTLFYSWQSDDPKTRSYIEKALKKALENIATDMSVENAPRFDKDTQGEVGAVSITATIKRKISNSKIFLADASLIDKGLSGKKLSNQNVMFELGYAFGKKTENAVMLVANKDLGEAKELPFDIAQNRVIFFSSKDDPKAVKFVPNLEGAIKAHLGLIQESEVIATQENAKEQLISAIENNKPTQTKAEVYFEKIYEGYLTVAPELSKGGEPYVAYGERTFNAYEKTLPLTVELYDVVRMAAEYGDMRSLTTAYGMLGHIAARNDQHGNDEYASLLAQEIASVILGCLAKFDRWVEIQQLIATTFSKPKDGRRKYKIEDTYEYPEGIKQYYNQRTGKNYSIPTTPMIQERFVDNDKILKAYVAGSLILMFSLDFYYPYISGLLLSEDGAYTPDYIPRLSQKSFATNFAKAVGDSTIDELQQRLDAKREQLLSNFGGYWNRNLTHIFNTEGLMPINEKVGVK